MFKIIDDKDVADELWQAGVLWWRNKSEGAGYWRLDDTQETDICAPSLVWEMCDHAVQIEE